MPLVCKTDFENCCGTEPNWFGEFYYPNGIQVPIWKLGHGFYRSCGKQEVRLHRREGVTTPAQQAGSTVRYPMLEETYKLSTLKLIEHKKLCIITTVDTSASSCWKMKLVLKAATCMHEGTRLLAATLCVACLIYNNPRLRFAARVN